MKSKNLKPPKQKTHLIPFDKIFTPDPYENMEDTRPVEVRKGKRNNPDHSLPWEVIKNE